MLSQRRSARLVKLRDPTPVAPDIKPKLHNTNKSVSSNAKTLQLLIQSHRSRLDIQHYWRAIYQEIICCARGLSSFLELIATDESSTARFFSGILGYRVDPAVATAYLYSGLFSPAWAILKDNHHIRNFALETPIDQELCQLQVVYDCITNANGLPNLKKRLLLQNERNSETSIFFKKNGSATNCLFGLNRQGGKHRQLKSLSIDNIPELLGAVEDDLASRLVRSDGKVDCQRNKKWQGYRYKNIENIVIKWLSYRETDQANSTAADKNEDHEYPSPSDNDEPISSENDAHPETLNHAGNNDEPNPVPNKKSSKNRRNPVSTTKSTARKIGVKGRADRFTKNQKYKLARFLDGDGEFKWLEVLNQHLSLPLNICHNWHLISDDPHPPLLLLALSIAYPSVVKIFIEANCTLDLLLSAGRKARTQLNLPNYPDSPQSKPIFKASIRPMLSGSAKRDLEHHLAHGLPYLVVVPFLVHLQGAYSLDFKQAYETILDRLRYAKDDRSDANLRCSVLSQDLANMPVVKLGDYAILGVPADPDEAVLFQMHTELSNLFADATREVMRSILNIPNPDGYVSWKTHYQATADLLAQQLHVTSNNDALEALNRHEPPSKGILDEYKEHLLQGTAEKPIATNESAANPARRTVTSSSRKQVIMDGTSIVEGISRFIKDDIIMCDEDVTPFKCNLHIIKSGPDASFGLHQDGSYILNSQSSKSFTTKADGRRLPTPEEMSVFTTCLNSPGFIGHTVLQHVNKHTKEKISEIKILDNDVHIQSEFLQSGDIGHKSMHVKNQRSQNLAVLRGLVSTNNRGALQTVFDSESDTDDENDCGGEDDLSGCHLRLTDDSPVPNHKPVRVVITSRMAALPVDDGAAYDVGIKLDERDPERINLDLLYRDYCYTNALSGRTKIPREHQIQAPLPWNLNNQTTKKKRSATGNKDGGTSRKKQKIYSPISHKELDVPKFEKLPLHQQLKFHEEWVNVKEELPNLPGSNGKVNGIKKPVRYSGLRPKRAVIALRSKIVERFLSEKLLLAVALSKEKSPDFENEHYQPLFAPGGIPLYPTQILQQDNTETKKTKFSNKILDPNRPRVLNFEQLYKSIPFTFDLAFYFFHRLAEWRKSCHPEDHDYTWRLAEFEMEYEALILVSHGSGGSCNKPGANSMNAGTSGPYDCFHTTGSSQAETVKENSTLMWLCRMEAPVAVNINMFNFFSHLRQEDRAMLNDKMPGRNRELNDKILQANLLINELIRSKSIVKGEYSSLGYWQIESFQYRRCRSETEAMRNYAELPGYAISHKDNTSFLLEKSLRIELHPAFCFATALALVDIKFQKKRCPTNRNSYWTSLPRSCSS